MDNTHQQPDPSGMNSGSDKPISPAFPIIVGAVGLVWMEALNLG